jgi:uncharacterized membrane protein YbhN (UPF0104 family)
MHLSFLNIVAIIFTYVVFGYLGYSISKRFRRPVSLATWLVVVFVTFFASFFAPSAILIGGGEFIVHINEALQAIGVGIIIGLATREIRIKLVSN